MYMSAAFEAHEEDVHCMGLTTSKDMEPCYDDV